jgi:hypothetical protein
MLRNRQSFTARRRSRAPDMILTAPQRRVTLERVLALPAVDHMLGRLLSYPRALQSTGIVVGLLMALLALYPLVFPSSRLAAPPPLGPSRPLRPFHRKRQASRPIRRCWRSSRPTTRPALPQRC